MNLNHPALSALYHARSFQGCIGPRDTDERNARYSVAADACEETGFLADAQWIRSFICSGASDTDRVAVAGCILMCVLIGNSNMYSGG